MNDSKRYRILAGCLAALILGVIGCKKQVTVDPSPTNPTEEMVFSTDAGVASAITAIYGQMSRSSSLTQGYVGVSLIAGLAADELKAFPESGSLYMNFYTNSKNIDYSSVWKESFKNIYRANLVMEEVSKSPTVSDSAKKQFIGEAKFIRAFFNFYLVGLFGDLPLVLSSDFMQTKDLSRSPKSVIYQQVIKDLKDAIPLLKEYFVTPDGKPTDERVRPSRMAAAALLARVYLYIGEWEQAEAYSSLVIGNSKLSLSKLDRIFLKNSSEAIWQLQPVTLTDNSLDAAIFIRTIPPSGTEPVDLRPELLTQFEPGDQRKQQWVDSITLIGIKHYYPSKYRVKYSSNGVPPSEYPMMFRLTECFLVRAEANARMGRLQEAIADLKQVRSRAGLSTDDSKLDTKEKLLAAIMHERQIELFSEWGHRWFDLIRTETIDAVMQKVTPLKGGVWQNWCRLFPIPETEIAKAPNLVQNPGY